MSAPRSALRALAVIALSLVALGCSRRDAHRDDAPVIDVELMAFLSEARALHHRANLEEEAGDLAGASAAMVRLVTTRRPQAAAGPAPEIEEVLADAYARLAELHLRQGALAPASKAIAEGLVHAPHPTYFRGRLLEVEGLVEEARAAGLADAGKPEEASRARERAIALLEEVVRIQDQVIQRSLAARDAGRGGGR